MKRPGKRLQVTLVVQINGKLRARLELEPGATKDQALEQALAIENVQRHMDGKEVRKVIHIPDRLLNIVVGLKPMPARLITGILSLALLCTGCGFQLRDDVELPPQMAKTQMVIDDEYSTLARRVRVMLEQSGVQFVNAEEASAVLEIPVNNVVTDVLTIGDNARVREYRISHTVRFRLLDAEGQVLLGWQNLRQAREISFDEQRILAGSREQEYLKKELAETLSRLLIARLESMPAGSG